MLSYKFNFLMALFVGLVSFVLYLLSGDDSAAKLMIEVLGYGTTLYFLILSAMEYGKLKK